MMGREIKFKPATFYLGIADHLAKAVEGLKPGDRGDQGKDQVEKGVEPEPARSNGVDYPSSGIDLEDGEREGAGCSKS